MPQIRKKLVVVGDGQCGKTSLLIVFKGDKFYENYSPTVFDTYAANIDIEGQEVSMALWDTAGQEEYDRIRFLSYPDTNVILVCFSVDSPDSFENVEVKWIPEIKQFCKPSIPVILVCNKIDLREDENTIKSLQNSNKIPLTVKDGKLMADKIKAYAFLECSAKLNTGIKELFQTAARAALESSEHTTSCCSIQ